MIKEFSPRKGKKKVITFIVTKDCQLACKYCYLVGKNSNERMSYSIAQKAVDYILESDISKEEPSVVWEFIGGEPLLEINLIEEICTYIIYKQDILDHPWAHSFRFSIPTNGINYTETKIQDFIKKFHKYLSIGITIDGTPIKHDLNRVWKNSQRGSYENVVKSIPLWLKQFPNTGTKVTFSSEDLPYLKESIIHLFSLGIHEVHANVVFENVWGPNDDNIFEEQLTLLADEMIDKELFMENVCSLFSQDIGKPIKKGIVDRNWCGTGKMLSIDASGYFYPCTRFAKYSLRNREPVIIGNIEDGIDKNRLRPFAALTRTNQSSPECIDCQVASGCAWCQAENYDCCEIDTLYHRSTSICKMHKARVRANNYYWAKLNNKMK